jgi:hypothetical protein
MELLTGGGPYVPSVPQVPKPRAEVPHPWGVELQASLPPHFNLPGLCGLMPAAPWKGPAVLTTEVPNRAVAQWLTEVGKLRPTEFTWTVALMLLQRSAALECLEVHGAILAKLQPESLLLMAPRGCVPAGPPRLLLADFRLVHQWPQGPLGLHSLPLARLLCTLLSDPRPSTMPLAVGLKAVLPHTRPSAALTLSVLQARLWEPGLELCRLRAQLRPWLQVRRTLLLMHLAGYAMGGEVPGLEDWLCCTWPRPQKPRWATLWSYVD